MDLRTIATAAAAAFSTAAGAAGTVEVRFVEPRQFFDAGRGAVDTERTTRAMGQHLQRLGARLPDGQTLNVEVLNVDLAGHVRAGPRADLRVLRGGADWPRIDLRYTLRAGDRVLGSGEEQLIDLDYLDTPPRGADRGALPYEQRMLSRWFAQRFTAAQAQ